MPRDGAITFRDIVGKLAVLRITCDKCGRSGQYRVERVIMRATASARSCSTGRARSRQIVHEDLNEVCGARCPDLLKVA